MAIGVVVPACIAALIQKQYESQAQNENIWFLEKKNLNEQIKELEARVQALENINSDLINRNRMLEYCLRKIKYILINPEERKAKSSQRFKRISKCLNVGLNQIRITSASTFELIKDFAVFGN